jgi:hypothetical protein
MKERGCLHPQVLSVLCPMIARMKASALPSRLDELAVLNLEGAVMRTCQIHVCWAC